MVGNQNEKKKTRAASNEENVLHQKHKENSFLGKKLNRWMQQSSVIR